MTKFGITVFISLFFLLSPEAFGKSKQVESKRVTASKTEAKPSSAKPSPKPKQAKNKGSKKPASLTKEELLGEGYDTPPDSKKLRKEMGLLISEIEGLCEVKESKRVDNLQKIFDELEKVIDKYLKEPYLKTEDSIYLKNIRHMIFEGSFSVKEILKEMSSSSSSSSTSANSDLGELFLRNYYSYYNIRKNDIEAKGIRKRHKWAKSIHAGLNCVF